MTKTNDKQILSMIPADGWYAVFESKRGTSYYHRLAAWVAVRQPDPEAPGTTFDSVYGLEMEYGGGHLTDPSERENFDGYIHESEREDREDE